MYVLPCLILLLVIDTAGTDKARKHCSYGEKERDKFRVSDTGKRGHHFVGDSMLYVAMTCVFLGTPFRYLRYLDEVYDVYLPDEYWRLHIQRITGEWRDFNLLVSL